MVPLRTVYACNYSTVSVVVQQYTFLVVIGDIEPAINMVRQKEERDWSLFTKCLVQNTAAAAEAVRILVSLIHVVCTLMCIAVVRIHCYLVMFCLTNIDG